MAEVQRQSESFGIDICNLNGEKRRLSPLRGSTSLLSLLVQVARTFEIPVAELCAILGWRILAPSECRRTLAELGLVEGSLLTVLRDATAASWPGVAAPGQAVPLPRLACEPRCQPARGVFMADLPSAGTAARRSRSFGHVTHSDREWQQRQLSEDSLVENRTAMLDVVLGSPEGGLGAPAHETETGMAAPAPVRILQVVRRRRRRRN